MNKSAVFTSMVAMTAAMLVGCAKQKAEKVQLWRGGPYWATKNIGAETPKDYGLYFWWGDTLGYRRDNDAWVASDGSLRNCSFGDNALTYNSSVEKLKRQGWITENGVLAPVHDAAHILLGGAWRMPTGSELSELINNCDWTWIQNGYAVRGRGDYASSCIFLPAAGYGEQTSICYAGKRGFYWSSDTCYLDEERNERARLDIGLFGSLWGSYDASNLYFAPSSSHSRDTGHQKRFYGMPIRPVQGFAK